MNTSEHTHRLSISWWLANILVGSFTLISLLFMLANDTKDIFSRNMGFLYYLEIIFLLALLLPFSIFLLMSSFKTKVIVKTSGIEYHTPTFILRADWKNLDNLGYVNDKVFGKTLVVVPRDGNLTLRNWAKPFQKVFESSPENVKIKVIQFRKSNGHSFEEDILINVSQYTGLV